MADQAPAATTPPAGPDTVMMVDGIGRLWELPTENAPAALDRGFRLETLPEAEERQKKAQYGNRELEAGAAGLARSASFGVSDWALTHPERAAEALTSTIPVVGPLVNAGLNAAKGLGLKLPETGAVVEPSTLQGLAEYNKGATLAGEAAGVFTPGPGLAGKAGGWLAKGAKMALGESLLARMAAKGLGAALEGSFYGAGSALSESVLGDTQLTAEKLIAHMGLGALLGLGVGTAGEALETAATPVLKGIGSSLGDLQAAVKGEAERRAVKAAGAIKSDLKGMTADEVKQAGRGLLDAGLVSPAESLEDRLARAEAGRVAAWDQMDAALKQADANSGKAFDFRAVRDAIENDLIQPNRQNPMRLGDVQSVLDELERHGTIPDTIPFSVAHDIEARLSKGLFNKLDPSAKQQMAERVAGILNDQVNTQLANAAPDVADAWLEANRLYGLHKKAVMWGEAGLSRQAGNRFISLSDYLSGGLGGALGGLPGAIAGAVAHKVVRERGAAVAASALDALAQSPIFGAVSKAFGGFVRTGLANEPELFGKFRSMLQQAAAHSDDELLLTHGVLAESDPQYRDTMTAAGLDLGEPGLLTARKALALSAMQGKLNEGDREARETVAAWLEKPSNAKPSKPNHWTQAMGLDESGDFPAQVAALRRLAADPLALQQRLALAVQPIAGDAPNLATGMSATAARAVAFLAGKLPGEADPLADVPALRRPSSISEADRARWERYAQAVAHPTSVYASLRDGAVTREAVEALQAVYPSYFADLQRSAMDALAAHPKSITYQQRLALGALLGTALDPSAQPQRLLSTQQMIAGSAQQQAAAKKAQPKPVSAEANASESQRLEARR